MQEPHLGVLLRDFWQQHCDLGSIGSGAVTRSQGQLLSCRLEWVSTYYPMKDRSRSCCRSEAQVQEGEDDQMNPDPI